MDTFKATPGVESPVLAAACSFWSRMVGSVFPGYWYFGKGTDYIKDEEKVN